MKRLLLVAILLGLAIPCRAVEVSIAPSVVVLHYVQSGWHHPLFAVSEVALGPARIGGFYVGGIGLRQVDGFGTVYPLISYVGQGTVPKLKFLKGVTVTFAMCNEGIFKGKPAYFFGVGVTVMK
jgi:hypothetical protein